MDLKELSNITVKRVHSISNIYTEKGKVTSRSNRPFWAIILKYEGETVYTNEGQTHISNAQNMVILPKGSCYTWQCTQSGRYFVVEFDSDAESSNIFTFRVTDNEKILRTLKNTEAINILKPPHYKLETIRNVYSLLIFLLETKQPSYTNLEKRKKIFPALEYISQNYNQHISNEQLSNLTGMSTVYFRKLFTAIMGVSPITYLHQLRIKKAKKMLQSDYENLSEIAYSLGYADVYTFSKTFKKHEGISPSVYRKEKNQRI